MRRLSPGEIADLLREWYADCSIAVPAPAEASIDKFIGDCFFAYWRGTEPALRQSALQVAHHLRAIETTPTTAARRALMARHGMSIDCRFGLHLGCVAVGAMGIGINTALGDAVNVVFRIEAVTRELDRPILASGAFVEDWPEGRQQFFSCGLHLLKGVEEPIELFAPRKPDGQLAVFASELNPFGARRCRACRATKETRDRSRAQSTTALDR